MNTTRIDNSPDTKPVTIQPVRKGSVARDHGKPKEVAALTLDELGMIRDCNSAGELLFGYRCSELVWHHISMLLPQLSGMELVRGNVIDPQLDFLCHCGKTFALHNRTGDIQSSELSFVQLENDGKQILRLLVKPVRD